jgi:hypothetical protein
MSWDDLVDVFNGVKPEFHCFFRWRNNKNQTLKFSWNEKKDKALLELASKYEGIWRKIAGEMDDNLSTKNQMTERYGAQSNSYADAASLCTCAALSSV